MKREFTLALLALIAVAAFGVSGCENKPSKDGVKPNKDSYKTYPGQREGEAPAAAIETKTP